MNLTFETQRAEQTPGAPLGTERRPPRQGRFSSAPSPVADGPVSAGELPRLLLAHEVVTQDQLQSAIAIQRDSGAPLGEVLVDEGFLSEADFFAFLARHCHIPHLSLRGYAFDEALLASVPRDLCLKHRLVPLDRLGAHLTLAMVNPFDTDAIEAVRSRCPELTVRPVLCNRRHFDMLAKRVLDRRKSLLDSTSLCRRSTDAVPASDRAPDADRTQRPVCPIAPATAGPCPGPAAAAPPSAPPANVVEFNGRPDSHVREIPPTAGNTAMRFPSPPRDSSPARVPAMIAAMRDTFLAIYRDMPLFHGLTPETAAQIMACARFLDAPAGTTLPCRMGEGDAVYLLLAGAAECRDSAGRTRPVAAGNIITHVARRDDDARPVSLRITDHASLIALSIFEITAHLPSQAIARLLLNIVSDRDAT